MKIVKIALVSLLAVLGNTAFASSTNINETVTKQHSIKADTVTTDTFKVYGNCGMCKATIEGSLKDIQGIEKVEWNIETKMINVSYNKKQITLDDIKKKIAEVGYDTNKFRASDFTYGNLPGCCQYERPENDAEEK